MAFKDNTTANKFFRERYEKNCTRMQEYKVSVGCTDCGYNAHHAGLEFDHVQPHLRGTVASIMGRSWNVIQQEIDRCEVVCSTCHSIRTWNRLKANQAPVV